VADPVHSKVFSVSKKNTIIWYHWQRPENAAGYRPHRPARVSTLDKLAPVVELRPGPAGHEGHPGQVHPATRIDDPLDQRAVGDTGWQSKEKRLRHHLDVAAARQRGQLADGGQLHPGPPHHHGDRCPSIGVAPLQEGPIRPAVVHDQTMSSADVKTM